MSDVVSGRPFPPGRARAVPTAPGRNPLAGHAGRLGRDPLGFVCGLRQHGNLVRIYVGPKPVYVLNSADLIRQVLVTDARAFDKGALFDELRGHLGEGLVTSSGAFHHRQRRLAQPAFHARRIERYAETMTQQAADLAASWRQGQQVDLTAEIDRTAREILLRTLFAAPLAPEAVEAIAAWMAVKHHAMERTLSPAGAWSEWLSARLRRPTRPVGRPGRKHAPGLRAFLTHTISEYRTHGTDRGDLLTMLLDARDARTGEGMRDAEVFDELLTLFTAGIGTVSAALAWTFHEIAGHPEAEQRLRDETDTVLGGRPAVAADLPKLPYTRRVAQEAMRLHPVWLLMRRAVRPVTLDGVALPAGTELFVSPHALHRDPALFPDPDRFDPDRWLPERCAHLPRGAYLTFGAGNRMCIGESFAWTEMAIVTATITGRWRLRPVPGDQVRAQVGTVTRPDRLRMIPELPAPLGSAPRGGIR
ncbi:cytochrome P450 [Streptomyces sp. NPDC048484]|uniref:cytochrome P450 n=1 Tax=Streptomyces sp. NPDC048484 TaxID=3155146 RepID=UPI0034460905